MKIFKDANNKDWTIDINLDARNQVKERVKIVEDGNEVPFDLLDVKAAQRIAVIGDLQDAATVGQVLWALCREQAEKASIDERGFYRAIKGDVWDDACAALKAELVDFFPKDRRALLASAMIKAEQVRAMLIERSTAKLSSGEIEAEAQAMLSAAFTNSRDSSESTPDPLPQEN